MGDTAGTDTLLELGWGISRGRDTYGYNIRRLLDTSTGKRYRCMGGGYDMTGTVFAEWLQDVHQDRLRAIGRQAHGHYVPGEKGWQRGADNADGLYGMTAYAYAERVGVQRVTLDGACGIDSMVRIAEAIGLVVRRIYGRKDSEKAIIVTSPAS